MSSDPRLKSESQKHAGMWQRWRVGSMRADGSIRSASGHGLGLLLSQQTMRSGMREYPSTSFRTHESAAHACNGRALSLPTFLSQHLTVRVPKRSGIGSSRAHPASAGRTAPAVRGGSNSALLSGLRWGRQCSLTVRARRRRGGRVERVVASRQRSSTPMRWQKCIAYSPADSSDVHPRRLMWRRGLAMGWRWVGGVGWRWVGDGLAMGWRRGLCLRKKNTKVYTLYTL